MRSFAVPALAAALVLSCGGSEIAQSDPVRPHRTAPPPRPRAAAPAPPDGPEPISGQLPSLTVAELQADAVVCPPTCAADAESARYLLEAQRIVMPPGLVTGTPPAALWLQIVHPGAMLPVPRVPGIDLLGVVVAGRATVERAGDRDSRRTIEPWTAFFLLEGGAEIRSAGDAPAAFALVLAAYAPEAFQGIRSRLEQRPTRGDLVVRPLAEVADLSWAGGGFHARIAFDETLSPRGSLTLLIGSRDAPVPEHDHPHSWELLLPLRASGTLKIADRDHAVRAGQVVQVPPATRHAWQPDGSGPFFAIQSYGPPGPEARFRTMSAPPRK